MNTKSARSGDKFSSQVEVPVTAHDRIVIPVGSYIIGYVDKSKRAGRLKGKAELTLKFDTVILPRRDHTLHESRSPFLGRLRNGS